MTQMQSTFYSNSTSSVAALRIALTIAVQLDTAVGCRAAAGVRIKQIAIPIPNDEIRTN